MTASVDVTASAHRTVRRVGTHPASPIAGALGSLGLFLWGGMLTAWFSGYETGATDAPGMVVLGTAALLLLVGLAGAYGRFVDGRLGRVAAAGMALALVAVAVGALVGLLVPSLAGIPAVAGYLFVVGTGTLLGVALLLRGAPRLPAATLTASGPVFLVTDKLLWDPLAAALGFDIAGLLSTWPLALGLLLLARATWRTPPTNRPVDTPADESRGRDSFPRSG